MNTKVKFWGVRGSVPVSAPSYTLFGGHTSCVSVSHKDNIFIFDAGTGLRDLGEELTRVGIKKATLILSHFHFDHIIGLPFFAPIWDPSFHLTLISPYCHTKNGLKHLLEKYIFSEPLFPVKLDQVPAQLTYIDCNPSKFLEFSSDCCLHMASLNHPGDSFGYQLECAGTRIAYVSDTEHIPGKDDLNVLKLMQNADLAIYDAMYTEHQFEQKKGWGHSTAQEGIRLSQKTKVKKLAFYHHNPLHTDDILLKLEEEAQKKWSDCFVARQGQEVNFL